ncbi:MAG TPA: sulfatase-like hydrolase/transferase [Blastocatellia bacterium]|nr:sulfatase-like hydrolase/transferase [Blastocatellia bacterium]
MSKPTTRPVAVDDFTPLPDSEKSEDARTGKTSLPIALALCALTGAAAAGLLALIELVDLNIQLTPVFSAFSDRVIFAAYFSMNLLVGSVLGLAIGLLARAATLLKRPLEKLLARGDNARPPQKILAGLLVCGVAAILLKQQPHIHGFLIGIIREAEKISVLRSYLLYHERSTSYLILFGFIVSCWLVWAISRAAGAMHRMVRVAWMLGLAALMAVAYYIDSRIEVQNYEPSLHRLMFVLASFFAFALVASIYFSSAGLRSLPVKAATLALTIALIAGVAFTSYHFDRNQNLKTQIFYRTTQAKQHFNLAQWALDFDRDGYSPYLGGGDADDSRGDINPGETERIGDGVDNNCIGGDLTAQALEDWKRQQDALNAAPNPSPQRFNIIYIFIDTLRADHMGVYGYHRNITPNMDRLAARSQVFENAFSPSPGTFEAMPKFMQSAYWDGHYPTWTEVLNDNGYNSMMFARRIPVMKRYVTGMRVVNHGKKGLVETIDSTIETLSRTPSDRPFSAYVYSSDPHRTYEKHEEFSYGHSDTDLYDGEIAYTDFHMGRLFDWMESSGRMKDTVVVIMADHGESLGERGVYKHSSQLYNEQTHVPMIIYVPNLAPRRISAYVSTVDLGSTILNLVGIAPPEGYAGVSLLPLMRGEPFAHPPIYGEQTQGNESPYVMPEQNVHAPSKKYMVITQDGYKLIYNRNHYNFELFNLKDDPQELRNLYESMPEKAQELKALLGRFIDIVSVSRPWNADESKYSRGYIEDNEQL